MEGEQGAVESRNQRLIQYRNYCLQEFQGTSCNLTNLSPNKYHLYHLISEEKTAKPNVLERLLELY